MDDKQALLEKFLKSKFDIDTYRDFIARFFYKPEIRHSLKSHAIEGQFRDYISSFTEVAKYVDSDNRVVTFMAVEIIREKSVERVRNMQRNYMAKLLEKNEYDAAIVAFYNEDEKNWRLSFVKLDYSFTEKGIMTEITPAKRYSYLVGEDEPNHTAQEQFYKNLSTLEKNPTVDELEKIFEIEKVTKDFFEKYKNKYLELKEYLDSQEDFLATANKFSFTSEEFAKKLMGQIAFLYFLQKKGWLGVKIVPQIISIDEFQRIWKKRSIEQERDVLKRVFVKQDENTLRISSSKVLGLTNEEGDILAGCFVGEKYEEKWGAGNKKFIRYLFESCKKSSTFANFFHDWLEPLFYTALNQKRGNNQYFKKFNCKIPFLNGGLFEHMYGSDEWEKKDFSIPNEIFSNKTEKDEGTGILDVFDIYNFTMNEDEPLEKEVAVDPEMLGKIFENLLDVTDRKSKGAFYTPREIVHYMCKESLINYLVNETEIKHDDIDNFIQLGEFIKDEDKRTIKNKSTDYLMPKSIIDKLEMVDNALENVKVADPAVGSGAFPLGMLNEIVKARDVLTEYYLIGKDKFEADEIRYSRSMYNLKKNAMMNSIHAVDIEPSAVDITKLRLRLSIIVDNDDEVIHELPNLDYKIMTGNSLIEEFEGMKIFDDSLIEKKTGNKKAKIVNTGQIYTLWGSQKENILNKVIELRNNYFLEKDKEKKWKIRTEIDRLEWDLIKATLTESGKEEKIKELEKLNKERRKPYFLWKWNFLEVFQEKGGFDIVIGNPPYVGEGKNKKIFAPVQNSSFGKKYYIGKMDFWYFFTSIGLNILKEKGSLNYIAPNNWLTTFGGKKMRNHIMKEAEIKQFINFGDYMVFENAAQQTMIFLLEKNNKSSEYKIDYREVLDKNLSKNNLIYFLNKKNDKRFKHFYSVLYRNEFIENSTLQILNNENGNLFERIKSQKVFFLNDVEIIQGIVPNPDVIGSRNIKKLSQKNIEKFKIKIGDGVFVLSENEISIFNDYEKSLCKPLYDTENINKYYFEKNTTKKILYIVDKVDTEKIPNIIIHLSKYREIMDERRENQKGSREFYNLHWGRERKFFEEGEKIIALRKCVETPVFSYTCNEAYFMLSVNIIKTDRVNLKYLTGVLNSKLVAFWLRYMGKMQGSNYQVDKEPLMNIPIKNITTEQQQPFIKIVDQIIDLKKQNQDTTDLEKQIDLMVYKLYNLTYEEVKVVEPDFAMSEEDYERYEQ